MSTALVVIDVQKSFRQRDDWDAISSPDIAEWVSKLVDHARRKGQDVVWVLHTAPGSGGPFDPELGMVALLPGLTPDRDELVVHKTSHNAFSTTNLAQHLTTRGVHEVVVVGIRTEQCCETTARVASDLGYQVRFVLDDSPAGAVDRRWSHFSERRDDQDGERPAGPLRRGRQHGRDLGLVDRRGHTSSSRFIDLLLRAVSSLAT